MRGRRKITSSQNTTHADFWTLVQEKMNLTLLLTVRLMFKSTTFGKKSVTLLFCGLETQTSVLLRQKYKDPKGS